MSEYSEYKIFLNNRHERKMSRWGVDPLFAILSIGYGIIMLAISRHFHPVFQIPFMPTSLLSALGIALISNDPVDIRCFKIYQCAKIITIDGILHL